MMSTPTPARTLADQLRGWPDERLTALVRDRPDLASPTPADSAQLASRASSRGSCQRALDQLTRLELAVLDAVVVLGPTSEDEVVGVVLAPPADVRRGLGRLRDLALVWESTSGLRALTGAAEALAAPPGGGSGVRPRSAEPVAADAALAELSPAARALLDHVHEAGGEGTTGDARTTVSPAEARTPVEELLARRLLVPRGDGRVVVPGEVALVLRGGRTTTEAVGPAPTLATSDRDPVLVDRTAAGAAFETVRRVELLLDTWGAHPPSVLRAGGLAVRDLKAAAVLLHVDEPTAALLVETAHAAGLVTEGPDAEGDPVWLPTGDYDAWTDRPIAERWTTLARAWLGMSRLPSLVGGKDRGGNTWNALAPDLSSLHAAETRTLVLEALAEVSGSLAPGTGLPSLVARLTWQRPRRPRTRADLVTWSVREAAGLGITGLDGLSSFGRALLSGDPATALAPLLPAEVDHVLLQADLTAVAPGPLPSDLARDLHLLSDVESRGGATVHRFSAGSVRRAFDAGWSAGEVHTFLEGVSRTPVPQPLTYLVDDVARTFGTLRVGAVEAFLRADDEALLSELLTAGAGLGLRRVAPTVLVSTVPLDVLLPRLREAGAAPVVEAADGSVHVARPDQQRARTRRTRPPAATRARETARLAAVVTAIRAGDRAVASRPSASPGTTPAEVLAALREALEAQASVWIGYVDNHGTSTERIVDPRSVDGGQLVAYDHRADDVRGFAIHRITGVRQVS